MPVAVTAADEVPRVRVLNAEWRALIDSGSLGSATLRDLLAELEGSDTIVHIVKSMPDGRKSAAALQFIVASGGVRFLRIRIAAGLPDRITLSLIGHELQHALEVAREPAVVDQESFVQFYRRVGLTIADRQAPPSYDTAAAREVQRRVFDELEEGERTRATSGRRPAAPTRRAGDR